MTVAFQWNLPACQPSIAENTGSPTTTALSRRLVPMMRFVRGESYSVPTPTRTRPTGRVAPSATLPPAISQGVTHVPLRKSALAWLRTSATKRPPAGSDFRASSFAS